MSFVCSKHLHDVGQTVTELCFVFTMVICSEIVGGGAESHKMKIIT